MVKLHPHALERRMLLRVLSSPGQRIRIVVANCDLDLFADDRNAAKDAVPTEAVYHCDSLQRRGHPNRDTVSLWDMPRGARDGSESVVFYLIRICRFAPPKRFRPSPDRGQVSCFNESCGRRSIASRMGPNGVVQQECRIEYFGDWLSQAAAWLPEFLVDDH